MFEAITLDAVRLFREFATTKLAELLAAVNAKAAEVLAAITGQGIKSVQRGTITINGSGLTATATISAVVMNKAELRPLGSTGGSSAHRMELTSPTQVTVIRRSAEAESSITAWELTEWK
ncbi:hypothetical protein [Acidovorax sp. M2(2025)]|uniref:hypothetical protein n=1 Tax=Acidovorax sp. M2(2025) TaxID=3411355 RepID=UPI003BF4E714